MNPIIWLTGHSGSGKTTIANALMQEIDCINLDGDEMRASISVNEGFSLHDRQRHNMRVAMLALVLRKQKTVVVSVIAPMRDVREAITSCCDPVWIHIHRNLPAREGHFYEVSPEYPRVDTNKLTVPECVKKVRRIAKLYPSKPQSILVGRYQPLHVGHKALIQKVLDEGKKVTVLLRDTAYGDSDPYTIGERKEMLAEAFGDRISVGVIPDLEEFCHGRKVGWGVRQIEMPEEIEAISATEIRSSCEQR